MSIVAGVMITLIGGLLVHEHRARAPQIHKKIILFAQKIHVIDAKERMANNGGCTLQDFYLELLTNSSGGDLTKLIISLSAVRAAIISNFNNYIENNPRSLRIAFVCLICAVAIVSVFVFSQHPPNTIPEDAVDQPFSSSTVIVDSDAQIQPQGTQVPITMSRLFIDDSRLGTSIKDVDNKVGRATGLEVVSFSRSYQVTNAGNWIALSSSSDVTSNSTYDALDSGITVVNITRRYVFDPTELSWNSGSGKFDLHETIASVVGTPVWKPETTDGDGNHLFDYARDMQLKISKKLHFHVYYYAGHGGTISTMNTVDGVLESTSEKMREGGLTKFVDEETIAGIQIKKLFEAAFPAQGPVLNSYTCSYYCTYYFDTGGSVDSQISSANVSAADWVKPSITVIDAARTAMNQIRETQVWATSDSALSAVRKRTGFDRNDLPTSDSIGEQVGDSIVGILRSDASQSMFIESNRYALSSVLLMLILVLFNLYLVGKIMRLLRIFLFGNISLRAYEYLRRTWA